MKDVLQFIDVVYHTDWLADNEKSKDEKEENLKFFLKVDN